MNELTQSTEAAVSISFPPAVIVTQGFRVVARGRVKIDDIRGEFFPSWETEEAGGLFRAGFVQLEGVPTMNSILSMSLCTCQEHANEQQGGKDVSVGC
jgi:hypothetical protein